MTQVEIVFWIFAVIAIVSALNPVCRAIITVASDGMFPASKIWVQRKENQPLRITMTFSPFANCRATASIA